MHNGIAILAQFDDFGNLWFIIALLVIAGARALGEKLKTKTEEQRYKKKTPPVKSEPGPPKPPRPAPPVRRQPRPPAPARPARSPVIVIAPEEGPRPQLTEPAPPPRARPAPARPAPAVAEPSERTLVQREELKLAESKLASSPDKPLREKKQAKIAKPTRRKFRVSRKGMRKAVILSEILRPPIALRENEAFNELG
jgi:translation initiation factor IF-2